MDLKMPHTGRVRPRYSLLDESAPAQSGSKQLGNRVLTAQSSGQMDESSRRSGHRALQSMSGNLSQQQHQSRERRHNRSFSGNSIAEKRPPTPPLVPAPAIPGSTYALNQASMAYTSTRREQRSMTPTAGFADSDVDSSPELSNHIVAGLSKNPFLPSRPDRGDVSPELTKEGQPGDWVNSNVLQEQAPVAGKAKRNSKPLEEYHQVEPVNVAEATTYGLTHAANTILIPPIPFTNTRAPFQPLSPRRRNFDEESGHLNAKGDAKLNQESNAKSSAFRQAMRGLWEFLKTPKGIIAAIYGFLVAFWGAAIVVFLLRIINFHDANKQGLWVEISSQIENGLFTITGIGMIPFRAIDTYRMVRIWQMKKRMAKLRSVTGLPKVVDEDDLPDPALDSNSVPLLTVDEQNELRNHQLKFQRSQTWYRPFATETNKAFSTETALIICCLNDGNSAFQILLCAIMWGLNRFNRPPWTTGILIPCAFGCAIGAAVLAWRGGRATRRSESEIKVRTAVTSRPRRIPSSGVEHMPLVGMRSSGKRVPP